LTEKPYTGIETFNNITQTRRIIMKYKVQSVNPDGKMFYNGNYCGVDRVVDVAKGKFVKPTFVHIIASAAMYGFAPLMFKDKKVLQVFDCPQCKSHMSMIKLVKKPDLRNRIHACKECGYRKMTPGFVEKNGSFVLV